MQNKSILIVIIVILSCFHCLPAQKANKTRTCKRATQFDDIMLAIQSKQGSLSNLTNLNQTGEWSIHGLWPNKNDDERFEYCCTDQVFNTSKLAAFESELKKYWYSNKGDDTRFWNYEWLKHGTCASGYEFGELSEYFKLALKLFKSLDLEKYINVLKLKNRNLHYLKLKKLIQQRFGAEATIACRRNFDQKSYQIIHEIRFCFNPKTLSPQNCKVPFKFCRGSKGKIDHVRFYPV